MKLKKDFHDYEITAIKICRESETIEIELHDCTSSNVETLKFIQVKNLYAEEMTMQNIILDIDYFEFFDSSFEFQRAESMLQKTATGFDPSKGKLLFLLQASVGMEIAIQCESLPEYSI